MRRKSAVSTDRSLTLSALTDEQLGLSIQDGDREALVVLVNRHHRSLIGYLYRLSNGDRPLAEDLAQETFLRLLKRLDQYQYPRPFKAWLYAIATNLARDHFKLADSRHTTSAPDQPGFWQGRDGQTGSLENKLAARETAVQQTRAVIEAIQSLPDHQREVILLRYYQSFSLADISAALDIPLGTVKSRLSLATKRLRELMELDE